MLTKLTDTSSNTYKCEEQLTKISSKLSNYEDYLEKLSIKDKRIQPLSLQITEISSKFLSYETRLDKLSIAKINKFGTAMKEHEEILNTKIVKNIHYPKYEASRSINQIFSPPNSHNYCSSSNQPSADITKLPLLKSLGFHSHASHFTKHLSPMTLEGDTLLQLQKWWDTICSAFFLSLSTNKSCL